MSKIPEPTYKMIMENVPILCVDLIIQKEDKILLIKRENNPLRGFYWIPGGRVLKNETLADAVKRKCREECGITPKTIKEIGTYEFMSKDAVFEDIKTGIHTLSVVFRVDSFEGKIKLDNDHSDFKWESLEECKKEKELKRALANLKIR